MSRGIRESLGKEESAIDLKTATESPLRTVFGNEFQTAGAEHRKARFACKCCRRGRLTQHRSGRSHAGCGHVVGPGLGDGGTTASMCCGL